MSGSRKLLSREAFKAEVFRRNAGRCVFCELCAADAHHILERKLFADGGYYVDNGAAVCESHHLLCERTVLSVEQVRAAAGISEVVLPEDFDPRVAYDKWGNRLWPSGLRSWGPLQHDTGARRALAAGGFLGCMMPSEYCEQASEGEKP